MREPLSPIERLCVAGRIISETCKAIWDELINKGYLDHPKSEHDWLKVAQEFEDRWNVPNALGAKDGKHVVMQAPARSGSYFFNYKKAHSIVLMAIRY